MPSFQRLLLLVLIPAGILCSAFPVSAQQADCLCLPIFPDTIPRFNDDSILIDTCGLRPWDSTCWEKALQFDTLAAQRIDTKSRMYTKYSYNITFDIPAVVLPMLPPDSIVEVPWEMIDTAYRGLRSGMEGIESTFGAYVLRKRNPLDSLSQEFEVRLVNYHRADSVINALNAVDHVEAIYPWETFLGLSSVSDPSPDLNAAGLLVYPLPARDWITIVTQEPVQTINFYDILGREVAVPSISYVSGADRLRLDLHTFPDGVWYLRVNNAVQSLIIQR